MKIDDDVRKVCDAVRDRNAKPVGREVLAVGRRTGVQVDQLVKQRLEGKHAIAIAIAIVKQDQVAGAGHGGGVEKIFVADLMGPCPAREFSKGAVLDREIGGIERQEIDGEQLTYAERRRRGRTR